MTHVTAKPNVKAVCIGVGTADIEPTQPMHPTKTRIAVPRNSASPQTIVSHHEESSFSNRLNPDPITTEQEKKKGK